MIGHNKEIYNTGVKFSKNPSSGQNDKLWANCGSKLCKVTSEHPPEGFFSNFTS